MPHLSLMSFLSSCTRIFGDASSLNWPPKCLPVLLSTYGDERNEHTPIAIPYTYTRRERACVTSIISIIHLYRERGTHIDTRQTETERERERECVCVDILSYLFAVLAVVVEETFYGNGDLLVTGILVSVRDVSMRHASFVATCVCERETRDTRETGEHMHRVTQGEDVECQHVTMFLSKRTFCFFLFFFLEHKWCSSCTVRQ